ncbi:hypothetical protein QJQ45_023018, partial [Haematococcus lacustris]
LSRTVLNSRHASRGQRHLAMQPTFGLADNPTPQMSSSQVQPGAAANKQPRGAAKMCSKEAHVGAAAISHAVQLPRWHMT